MKLFWLILYNVFFYPILFICVIILSIFNRKLRKGFQGRLKSISKIENFLKNVDFNNNIYWIHVASLGEFLQSKIIIENLKLKEVNTKILVSFSSPSGYENSLAENIDLKIYLPFDFPWVINKSISLIKPRKIIICSNDLWPNFIWIANRKRIHVNVFSLYMKKRNFLFRQITNSIFNAIYSNLASIYTVTDKDRKYLLKMIKNNKKIIIRVCGNPRYDTIEKTNFAKTENKPIHKREKRIVIASSHKEDDFIIPIIIKLQKQYPNIKILYVPHEPNSTEIKRLYKIFLKYKIIPFVFNQKDLNNIPNEKVVLIGIVGILQQIYWSSQIVYIGGGFSSGIHNIMEPSIAGVPIIFGPNYEHAYEANILLKIGGAFCINNKIEFKIIIEKLINNQSYLKKVGKISSNLVHDNVGASAKIVNYIIKD